MENKHFDILFDEDLAPPAADYKTDVRYLLEDVKVENPSEVTESHFTESDSKLFIKDEYQTQEILCDSIKEENGFLQCEKIYRIIKNENSTLATEVKLFSPEQEINARQLYENPHSYHSILNQETKRLAAEIKIKEEKPFFFNKSLKVKSEASNCESNNETSLDCPSPKEIHNHIENSHQVQSVSQRNNAGPASSVYEKQEKGSKENSQIKNILSCKVCNKAFTYKSQLVAHERKHTGKRPFSCKVCNKAFTSKAYLVIHERIHIREYPFSCLSCNKTFASELKFHKHLRLMKSSTPLKCAQCSFDCTYRCQLMKHKEMHRNNPCIFCGAVFSTKEKLMTHLINMKKMDKYTCDECNEKFDMKCELDKHMKLHWK